MLDIMMHGTLASSKKKDSILKLNHLRTIQEEWRSYHNVRGSLPKPSTLSSSPSYPLAYSHLLTSYLQDGKARLGAMVEPPAWAAKPGAQGSAAPHCNPRLNTPEGRHIFQP